MTYLVKVDNKKDYPYPNMRSRERDVVSPETFRYEIYFKTLSSGEIIKTIVTEEQYQDVELGREGKLIMQGTRFVRFEPA